MLSVGVLFIRVFEAVLVDEALRGLKEHLESDLKALKDKKEKYN